MIANGDNKTVVYDAKKLRKKTYRTLCISVDRRDSPVPFYFCFPRTKLLSDNLRETKAYHGIHLAPLTPPVRNCIDQLGCPCR